LDSDPRMNASTTEAAGADGGSSATVVNLDADKTSTVRLKLGWWNTRLSPKKGNAARADDADEETWAIASDVVRLLERDEIDVLALGEVTPAAAERLRAGTGYVGLEVPRDAGDHGIGILFNPRRAVLTFDKVISVPLRERELHRSIEVSVVVDRVLLPLRLILAHWPSRMVHEQADDRLALGSQLQTHIRNIIERDGRREAFVVVGGDFNDEPFDESLTMGLWGTRDRALARRQPHTLYNPFWRLLGERRHREHGDEETGAGTAHWRSGRATKWHTFDQFLVSSSLLGAGCWSLLEGATGIWDQAPLASALGLHREFDHYPVWVGVEGVRLEER